MVSVPGFRPIDPTSAAFLLAENRSQPMHVGGLQLFERPADAGPGYVREMFESMRDTEQLAPLFVKHPHRSVRTGGTLVWRDDDQLDIEHHVRHSALPQPGRVRELLELVGRLHSTRLAWERPLWETHVIEGLADGRVAMYTKLHHALVDGISAMRLMASVLSDDPDRRGMPAPFAADAAPRNRRGQQPGEGDGEGHDPLTAAASAAKSLADLPADALRSAMSLSAEAAGMPAALVKTLRKGLRNETSAVSLAAPRTIFNQSITGARRFAAQDWPVERMRAVGKATGTTINDVVLAMCSGAMRTYLEELDALPDRSMVSMVPVGLNAKQAGVASAEGGNAIGAVMVRLATDLADPADRLRTINQSMQDGKEALSSMTPAQIVAMSAIGMAPSIVIPALGMQGVVRPPFNLIISNVPGPRDTHYWNGAKLVGTYPVSIPINGMALNITCTSYSGNMGFGLTGCRRTVPHLQRLLTFLDDELAALEKAAGIG
ncbi:diacylglycerol O-acyltransferase [Nocardioides sp. J9]|uniref:WS/DGAT/MGAT family O-acyltransferase n=1 Tax=unclassified Nocardioides TaxID=2615069 RepID=UPI0005657933|nr:MULTISPECIES: wax ester/triacylglycerol synthase family O-acyltransferase [unclassified Nocardioides]TWG91010.1 diacylglycerol O-acyltransferase [Nocardioides sp. J9]